LRSHVGADKLPFHRLAGFGQAGQSIDDQISSIRAMIDIK
jgi:hypothetical protein